MSTAARLVAIAAALTATALTIVAPAGAASSCGARSVSQPFMPWLDPGHYFLMPGGDFETDAGWSFGGGARVVTGNEPFYAHSHADTRSALVPSGGWARSSSVCVDQDEPTMRFFVRNPHSDERPRSDDLHHASRRRRPGDDLDVAALAARGPRPVAESAPRRYDDDRLPLHAAGLRWRMAGRRRLRRPVQGSRSVLADFSS